ncbi:membrane lipoprotein lipid attachment site-containing protein [Anaerorhabdus furcosa]|nr:membrane lipoprotein lipid attachment site-containing protein [Anaerorhabdus furcosa]
MKHTKKLIVATLAVLMLAGCSKEKKKMEFNEYDNHELIVRYSELLDDNEDIRGLIQENLVSNQYTYEYDSHENDMNKLSVSDKDKGLLANLGESSTCQNIVYDNENSISCIQPMSKEKIEAMIPDFPEKEMILSSIDQLNTEIKFSYSLNESMTHNVHIEIMAKGSNEEVSTCFDKIVKSLSKYENIQSKDNHIQLDTNEIDMDITVDDDVLIYNVDITKLS